MPPPFLSFGHLGLFGAVNKVLVVSGLQSAFSAIVIVLAMISMSLLLRPTVREQFESRKPSHNRMFQFGIAFALCMVIVVALALNGSSKRVLQEVEMPVIHGTTANI